MTASRAHFAPNLRWELRSAIFLLFATSSALAEESLIEHNGNYWQVETPIAVNPADPRQLLGAAMMTQNGTITQGVFWSLDGGSTWTDIDVLPVGNPDADPVTAISAATGAFWLNYLAHDGKQYGARSVNQGQDWEVVTIADLGSTSCTSQVPPYDAIQIQIVGDKNDFVADNSPSSGGYGNLYCAWWSVAKGEPDCGGTLPDIISRIDFSRSLDGGDTWSTPITLTDPWDHGSDYLGVFGVDIEVGPNGEVYISWAVYDEYELNDQQRGAASALAFAYSLDEGATFSQPVRAVPDIDGVDYPLNLIDWTARVFSTPSMGVDRSDGPYRGRVYLSWLNHDYTDGNGNSSCCEPSPNDVNIRLVYQDPEQDGSVTWSGNETRIKVNQDSSGNAQFHSKLAVDPVTGTLGVVYFDRREAESDDWARIYMSLSDDGGSTWIDSPVSAAEVQLLEPACCSGEWWGDYIGLTMHGGVAFPCWYDERTEVSRVYVNRVVYQSLVEFANRSDDTELGNSFTDQPYDARAIDYDDDLRPDLLISNDSGSGVLLQNQLHQDTGKRDVPQFVDDNFDGFSSGQAPWQTRGLSLADIDNDGDLDAFLAAEDTANVRLYQLHASTPWFRDRSWSTSIGSTPALKLLAEDTWTAAWGDVDRDGRVDLFLGRAGTSSGQPSGVLADVLLRNVSKGASTIRFSDISSTAQINSAGNRTTVTASFGELGGDEEPELFVGDAGTTGSVLYRLASFNSSGLPVYDYEDGASSPHLPSISPDDYEEMSGSSFADMDSDGDLDLVLTKDVSSGNNALVLWGDGEGDFTGTPKKLASGFAISTPLASDLDFSGSIDLLLAPAADSNPAVLLSNFSPSQHASAFEDVTEHVGLDDGDTKVTAIVAADFSGEDGDLDGDFDLYLGRTAEEPDSNPATNTSSVFYRAGAGTSSSDDAPRNRWLSIRPRWPAASGVEWSAIGTIVAIELEASGSSPALSMAKIVNSDGNRAGEALGEVRFGLGTAQGPATVLIQWPDGKIQSEEIDDEDFNQTHVIDAAHHPDVVQESPSNGYNPTATYEVLGAGQAKWVITWYTEYAFDPALDQVVVTLTSGSCTSSKTLTPATSGVTHTAIPITGGRYKHVMTYQTATCGNCTYSVTVKSKVGAREDTGTATLNMSTCGGFEG